MDIGDRAKGKEEAMLSWIDRLRGKTSSPMPSSQHPYFRATSEEVEAGPGECWHHAMPLPDGRRMKSTTMPSAGVQELMWEALQHIDLADKSVLDIGAADGFFSLAAKASGAASVTALDLNYFGWPKNISAMSDAWNLPVLTKTGDFMTYEFEEKFDVVFCLGVLYHLENVFLAIRKLREITNIGGTIVIETQMTAIKHDLPIFESASDTFLTTGRHGKESVDSVGVSNYLFPNHAAMLNLADMYDLSAEALDGNVYTNRFPTRAIYVMRRTAGT
jgi:predicted nicotinamide N-methyase